MNEVFLAGVTIEWIDPLERYHPEDAYRVSYAVAGHDVKWTVTEKELEEFTEALGEMMRWSYQ